MIDRFKENMERYPVCPESRILSAVSGGIDSMVMTDLLIRIGKITGIAHCNFNLRGDESDGDQKFVQEYAERKNIPFFTISFETKQYAASEGLSVQMAARELRYVWLNKIKNENGFGLIAIGHNRDDSIETFFINLIRGTGIHGLSGINPENKDLIRPLLFASRKEIETYAAENNIAYREDSSNAETKYLRNKIRHMIIPGFEELNREFRNKMEVTMKNLRQVEDYLANAVEHIKKEVLSEKDGKIIICYSRNPECMNPVILFEILKEYGFNSSQVGLISESVKAASGRIFYSKTHRIVKDRERFIITENKPFTEDVYFIREIDSTGVLPLHIVFKKEKVSGFTIPGTKDTAVFDFGKIVFPLRLRKWKKGDKFVPFGMKNFKKVSDFFNDLKISIPEKEDAWLLTSGEDIIWIVNYRADDRYKVTSQTSEVLLAKLLL